MTIKTETVTTKRQIAELTGSTVPYAYITNYVSNDVTVIDLLTNTVTTTVNVGNYPIGVTINPAGTKVYVANYVSNTVSVIDTSTNTVIATVRVGYYPYGIAINPAGTKVYVANFINYTVSVIDTSTNTVIATVNVGGPYGVVVNPTGTKLYVTNSSSNVYVIDTATNTVTTTVNVGNAPYGIAINPAGTKVYVANYNSNNVSVIDTSTDTVTATVNVGNNPYGVAINPAGTKVYATNTKSHNVSVIDTSTNTVIATVNVGNNPMGVAVNPDGTKVYVANTYNNNVSVIDTATNTITATIPAGNGPIAFGQFIGLIPTPANVISSTLTVDTNDCTEPCTINGTVSWSNTGGTTSTATDLAITVNGILTLIDSAVVIDPGQTTTEYPFSLPDLSADTYTIQASPNANTTPQTITVRTPANITATDIMVTPSIPCIEGTCRIDVSVTWQNTGGTAGPFVPNIAIDGTSISPALYPSENLPAGASITYPFTLYDLTKAGSPHSICPVPN